MDTFNRFAKGIIGIFIISTTFIGLMVPIEITVLGLNPKEDIGILLVIVAFITGGVVGWIVLSKAKWLTIIIVFVVCAITTKFLREKYPRVYWDESYMFTAEIDGVSLEVYNAYAKHAAGWLDITAVGTQSKVIMFHLYCSWTGPIILNSNSQEFGSGAAYSIGSKDSPTIFATNQSYTGRVTISMLDLNAKKVSGTFEYRAIQYHPPGSRFVKVTGSFKDIPIK